METKTEQIERLKKNDIGYYALSDSDKLLLDSLVGSGFLLMRWRGGWNCRGLKIDQNYVYRIHKDYQPEPEAPVFEGCVLCEVYTTDADEVWYRAINGESEPVTTAPRFGCCGYVPKEKIGGVWVMTCMPIVFTDAGKTRVLAAFSDGDPDTGCQCIDIGWVVFREEVK